MVGNPRPIRRFTAALGQDSANPPPMQVFPPYCVPQGLPQAESSRTLSHLLDAMPPIPPVRHKSLTCSRCSRVLASPVQ
ncbi:hypothetical protein BKA93DRAFT_361628 [Sparassis latifolia]